MPNAIFGILTRYIYVCITAFTFGASVEIRKQRIWIHRDEVMDILEIEKEGKIKYYSYTYKIKGKGGKWVPAVRWDNLEQSSHVDRYDENSELVEQKPCEKRPLKEILKIVGIFRKNLMAMDVSEL